MDSIEELVIVQVGNETIKIRKNLVEDSFVSIRVVSGFLNAHDQYVAQYLGDKDYPFLAEGLRIKCDDTRSCHSWMFHLEDIPEFIRRYNICVKNNVILNS
jgi:hypothetical protein